ncbi:MULTISPECIES: outer membrane protein assembly factor BamD [Flavobacterium]|uniref:Beta-barrel assembly machine subunit BamD n=3 Tax=Flavobacterium TaxID=237 RepID=A0A521B946_9FLAO|nr:MULTISPECIES: outer membrane protein assembly factor BamD [Flavobacterium]KAF2335163.1 outer membrane protein assembly factor BamD [Flavobacterium nitrogenifigens]KAF2338631.1 outer membrane protein assembly factor BamD [Flavobacterium tistrianum]WDF65177.1 outer membrane protein assembly factor BamD [Flavobacterium sp. KACC 22763]SMO43575.1 Beta-barrel assembly machine subunit BamD [Flavobacterium nitrogenifigens]
MKKTLLLLIVVTLFYSCGEYQKALKNEDVAAKFEMATKMYDAGKYTKAIRLFEQLATSYRGKPQAEKLFYMFSQSYYKTKQYYLAGYQFEAFVSGYPRSEKVQEAAFLGAYSYSKLSPVYSLDQADTVKALEKLQAFIDNYPNSEYIPQANEAVQKLNGKLEKKAYENAKGYNTISDYKSALIAFDNFIADFPGTPFKEDALFYKYDSAYKLAINSIPSKMEERLHVAQTAYANLMKFKSDTKYKEKADEMNARVETDLQKFTK